MSLESVTSLRSSRPPESLRWILASEMPERREPGGKAAFLGDGRQKLLHVERHEKDLRSTPEQSDD